jgi:hypothetical protein
MATAAQWLAGVRRQLAGLPVSAALSRVALRSRHAEVVQAVALGPGTRLLVVEFGGRRLLIGQSRAGLARLAEADMADLSALQAPPA